ncbi:hypothetical protein [Limnohabitans sp. B9-3]|uniref:hypothetical protein n=1 Tax=Limnohabitans sp. B9-3 TaxID=1100707 RepID=UPI00117AE914|nr:hypothetical protein [Limnohabitans sp. B9-3]
MNVIRKSIHAISLIAGLILSGCSGDSTVVETAKDALIAVAETDAVVDGVDLSESLDQEGVETQIAANKTKTMTLYGTNLQMGLKVTFNGQACLTHDLVAYDNENEDSGQTEIQVDCPGQAVGRYELKVVDSGKSVYSQNIDVVDASLLANLRQVRLAGIRPVYGSSLTGRTASVNPMGIRHQALALLPSGGGIITGIVNAQKPGSSNSSAALNYASVTTFPVRGVVVKLLDVGNNDAVLGTTATDASGSYTFSGVPASSQVKVQVIAQIAETRATGVTTGAQYNFMLRNNTATGAAKPFYALTSGIITSSGTTDFQNFTAQLGFDASGNALTARESAPFAILDVVYNAVAGIKAADPNVTLPDLNIYWSPENTAGDGDKTAGKIGTSHFSDSGDYPGVFILGKADVDTDEFDRGVIGHEFGHYLQFAASYSDNPGGSHGSNEFKDASLAYGEGFGTAIGGLLSGSQYYTDSSGLKQSEGGVQDLLQPPPSGTANGFYAENSVAYLLYKLGNQYGFTSFWKATTSLKTGHESATVFNFLDKFITNSGGAASRDAVLSTALPANIKTVHPLGVLDPSVSLDAAINASTSGGADDLEVLYKTLSPTTPINADVQKLTATGGEFCLNKKLRGSSATSNSNGLGWTKRFTFTSTYTGTMGVKTLNGANLAYPDGTVFVKIRNGSTGKSVPLYNWDGAAGRWNVTQGVTYSIVLQVADPAVFPSSGNACGNTLTLWQAPVLQTL